MFIFVTLLMTFFRITMIAKQFRIRLRKQYFPAVWHPEHVVNLVAWILDPIRTNRLPVTVLSLRVHDLNDWVWRIRRMAMVELLLCWEDGGLHGCRLS